MSHSQTSELVDDFLTFFRRYCEQDIKRLAERYPNETRSLRVDWEDLYRYDADIADDYLDQPDKVREYAEEALRLYDLPIDMSLSDAHVRVVNLPTASTRTVGEYLEKDLGCLLSVRGQVSKIIPDRPVLTEAVFECQRCGTPTTIPQPDASNFMEPHECQGCERQGPFRIDFDQSEREDFQLARLQLPPELAQGKTDDTLDIQLRDDIVNEVSPGDRVKANIALQARQKDENSPELEYYAQADSVEVQETDWQDLEIEPYKDEFMAIAHSMNPYQKIVDSINPTHKGDEDIKLALALQMFGGVKKEHADGSVTRGNFHVFLVGDPGTGKSGHLRYVSNLSPRSVYTSGKGGSSAGLTAACVRDEFGDSEWSIEGGAMVKANNGLAAIDELDKMDESDRAGMFEVLSEQQVSVSKAGINATLPAETSLLAGANPEYGRFDQYESIGEQINLDPALISRFDLIFTLTDRPDPDRDMEIIEHKNDTWENGLKRASKEIDNGKIDDDAEPEISPEVMRAYIAYAKQNVVPIPTEEAKELIKKEFSNIRLANLSEEDAPVPVTWRNQEAIQRLAEASARIRLSDTVTVDDVERALKLVKDCLSDVGIDPDTGEFDADALETGTTKSQRDRKKWALEKIQELEDEHKWGAPIDGLLKAAENSKHTARKVKGDIQSFKNEGKAYEPKEGYIRVT